MIVLISAANTVTIWIPGECLYWNFATSINIGGWRRRYPIYHKKNGEEEFGDDSSNSTLPGTSGTAKLNVYLLTYLLTYYQSSSLVLEWSKNGPVIKWSGFQMVLWKPDKKVCFVVKNVRFSNLPLSTWWYLLKTGQKSVWKVKCSDYRCSDGYCIEQQKNSSINYWLDWWVEPFSVRWYRPEISVGVQKWFGVNSIKPILA